VGRPDVTDIVTFGIDEKELIRLAASVEKDSEHPLAEAVVRKAKSDGIDLADAKNFYADPGKGVFAMVDNREVVAGNRMIFEDRGIDVPENIVSAQAKFEAQGKTVIMVSLDGKIAGILAIADKLKATAKDAVAELKKMKLRVVMITGDNARSASVIAGQIGIEDVFSQVLPEEKANEVKKLQEKGSVVLLWEMASTMLQP